MWANVLFEKNHQTLTHEIKSSLGFYLLAIMCSWVPLSILKYIYNKYNLLYEQLFLDGMGFKVFSLRLLHTFF